MLISVACQKEITEPDSELNYSVTTYAGGKTSGPLEGHTDSVFFDRPNNLALDREGNLLVSDRNMHRVRKINSNGMVVTVAGETEGFADGQGRAARFNTTRGLAVDAGGNIYVADRNNHSIRKITPGGTVSTLAGNGTAGYADGAGAAARFDNPLGIAVDAKGNVYVADTYNDRIRRIAPDGSVSTLAGNRRGFADGEGTAAQFDNPIDIVADTGGNLYIADLGNHSIRKITPGGTVSTLAGNGTAGYADGAGAAAQFNSPQGIALDKYGNLYVTDSDNHRVRKISPMGTVSTIAGNGTAGNADGPGGEAQFNRPRGIAVDPEGNFLFVADRSSRSIRKLQLK
jgi:sugar lactone lactonase YvrE